MGGFIRARVNATPYVFVAQLVIRVAVAKFVEKMVEGTQSGAAHERCMREVEQDVAGAAGNRFVGRFQELFIGGGIDIAINVRKQLMT